MPKHCCQLFNAMFYPEHWFTDDPVCSISLTVYSSPLVYCLKITALSFSILKIHLIYMVPNIKEENVKDEKTARSITPFYP